MDNCNKGNENIREGEISSNNNFESSKVYGVLWKQKLSSNPRVPTLRGKISIAGIDYSILVYNNTKKSIRSPDFKIVLTTVGNSNNKNKMMQLHLGGLM